MNTGIRSSRNDNAGGDLHAQHLREGLLESSLHSALAGLFRPASEVCAVIAKVQTETNIAFHVNEVRKVILDDLAWGYGFLIHVSKSKASTVRSFLHDLTTEAPV
jgi:hypothetical protein